MELPTPEPDPATAGVRPRTRVLVDRERSQGAFTVLELRLPPGGATPALVHEHEERTVVLVAGAARVEGGGASRALAPGAHASLARGVPHRITGGPRGARLVVVLVPGGVEDAVRAVADRRVTADDAAAILAAAGIHRVPSAGGRRP